MNRPRLIVALCAVSVTVCLLQPYQTTVLRVRIGQTYQQVERASTFPVKINSTPSINPGHTGATWVQTPAVIIRFDDLKHGFTLPPTTFAAITYEHDVVSTIATSPMLRKQNFNSAIAHLVSIQEQLQSGQWQLAHGARWFDLTRDGLARLKRTVRSIDSGYKQAMSLRIPGQYSVTVAFYCAARCDSSIGLDRYMIDVGVSGDIRADVLSGPSCPVKETRANTPAGQPPAVCR